MLSIACSACQTSGYVVLSFYNSAGGVMGKMIAMQSIVVASTAAQWYGHEGDILRCVFLHSLALAALVGAFIFLIAPAGIRSRKWWCIKHGGGVCSRWKTAMHRASGS